MNEEKMKFQRDVDKREMCQKVCGTHGYLYQLVLIKCFPISRQLETYLILSVQSTRSTSQAWIHC